ncbi:poly(ADP-ribose) glycohydrolase ARH3 isoform X2 [Copidosoma floridanum]|uniref:poly(ADP-ribose) glycohydrolase ARH3 isoform X2 n=1 Tax=Copidosoma floridanum TaxID=29053 RepID=UPI0006C9E4DF|nr:poly(ADP-ribose) glycohydrolase ARH3 isoform X2 [Copidosoma floridanum]
MNSTKNMTKLDVSLLGKKFRGSMLGCLAGDCIGSPYEGETMSSGDRVVLQNSYDKLEGPMYRVMQFSDDSAMTKSVAESLIEKKDLDLVDMAKKFVKSYYQEPHRGYGQSVVTVFKKLRGSKFTDVLLPAREQFNGQGSFGNGAAMRVTPIALFCYNNYERTIDMARQQSLLTHTHKIGIDGAILQAMAIQQSLHSHPKDEFDAREFVDDLIDKMNFVEADEEGLGLVEPQPYKKRLTLVKKLLSEKNGNKPTPDQVVHELGNDITGVGSVPTAIFCFLRAQSPIEGIRTENPLRRAIQYAVSLGGDTDTIGCMTGAIAGAFYGDEKLSPNVLQHCEGSEEFKQLADKLLDAATSVEWNSN